jgi:hypothetical protein
MYKEIQNSEPMRIMYIFPDMRAFSLSFQSFWQDGSLRARDDAFRAGSGGAGGGGGAQDHGLSGDGTLRGIPNGGGMRAGVVGQDWGDVEGGMGGMGGGGRLTGSLGFAGRSKIEEAGRAGGGSAGGEADHCHPMLKKLLRVAQVIYICIYIDIYMYMHTRARTHTHIMYNNSIIYTLYTQ